MIFARKRAEMTDAARALPGRASAIATAATHFVNGNPLKGPYPKGSEQIVVAMGCYWGAERKFWELPGVWVTAVGNAGGFTPNPTYEEVCSGLTGHTESVLVVFEPSKVSLNDVLKVFWEAHDPTQGMRQGNDTGTQYRSAIYWNSAGAARCRAGFEGGLPEGADGAGLWRHHHGDCRGGALLFRRDLSPAISRQESARLLRDWRHGRGVRDRHGGWGLGPFHSLRRTIALLRR